jgi:predicted enzyme related to lactoylglutathione lyase
MKNTQMLRGMATVNFWADDLKAARDWYTKLLGTEAYFQRPDSENPAYIEFRLGDSEDEFGIIDRSYAPETMQPGPGGSVLYWHVDDVQAALDRVLELGATLYDELTERGRGFITASVVDPFGNILGLQYNPHYLEILAATRKV